jgi:hypothetical protein
MSYRRPPHFRKLHHVEDEGRCVPRDRDRMQTPRHRPLTPASHQVHSLSRPLHSTRNYFIYDDFTSNSFVSSTLRGFPPKLLILAILRIGGYPYSTLTLTFDCVRTLRVLTPLRMTRQWVVDRKSRFLAARQAGPLVMTSQCPTRRGGPKEGKYVPRNVSATREPFRAC